MAVEEKLALEGVVEEALPNLMFRVELDNGHSVLAHMAGRFRGGEILLCGSSCMWYSITERSS